MNIRPVHISDLPVLLELNEAAVPHVNSIPLDDFEYFMEISSFFWVIEAEGEIAGFLIVLGPGQDYSSENYRYFSSRYSGFDYVDRIVIGEKFRAKGLGTALYEKLIRETNEQRICCEVNLKPPNPQSLAFHKQMGFSEVGTQTLSGSSKEVCLMSLSAS